MAEHQHPTHVPPAKFRGDGCDQDRIDRAKRKRERKAAKLLEAQAKGAIG